MWQERKRLWSSLPHLCGVTRWWESGVRGRKKLGGHLFLRQTPIGDSVFKEEDEKRTLKESDTFCSKISFTVFVGMHSASSVSAIWKTKQKNYSTSHRCRKICLYCRLSPWGLDWSECNIDSNFTFFPPELFVFYGGLLTRSWSRYWGKEPKIIHSLSEFRTHCSPRCLTGRWHI